MFKAQSLISQTQILIGGAELEVAGEQRRGGQLETPLIEGLFLTAVEMVILVNSRYFCDLELLSYPSTVL